MVDALCEVWYDERVHLMHVCASPQDPHAENSEEGEPVGHTAVVRGESAIFGPNVHILSKEEGANNEYSEKDERAIPQIVFFDSHFLYFFITNFFLFNF